MEDYIQSKKPKIEIKINKVGITNLVLPLKIRFNNKVNYVTAKVEAFVDLPARERGTHMSRMVSLLHDHLDKEITPKTLSKILDKLKQNLHASHSYLNAEFVLFKEKKSPVTKNKSYMSYKCRIDSSKNSKLVLKISTEVFVTSLCPISKSISNYSAHNQRGKLTAEVICRDNFLWFDEIIQTLEKGGSCEIYTLLKREDEKYVTEKAYENAKIVEDIIREIAQNLKENKHITEFKVSCENFESIHLHNAFSEIKMKNGFRN